MSCSRERLYGLHQYKTTPSGSVERKLLTIYQVSPLSQLATTLLDLYYVSFIKHHTLVSPFRVL